ncbi:MAG: enoyl-CoA hydratase/isomerase family protein [Panacagrimonas sp.]
MTLAILELDPATGIAKVTVNRPEVLNAIDVPTARAIRDAVLPLAGDSRVRCVVLSGAGRAFVAGGDLTGFAADFDRAATVVDELLDALHPAIETLRSIDAPVIAAVHGAAAGAGLSLMAGCDLVVAAEGTRFIVAYDRIGASPDCGGTFFLPRMMGERRAAQFVMLSETLDAAAALQAGLVNRVVAPDRLAAEVDEMARKIAAGPTRAYGQYKRLAARAFDRGLHEQLEAEREAFRAGTRTADFREGVSAFIAKRPATFNGK